MKKIIRNYLLQITQDFSTWKLPLPYGAQIVGLLQIGGCGHFLVMEDADYPAGGLHEIREFLTVTVGRDFEAEAPERLKFLGVLLLQDAAPPQLTITSTAPVFIPLLVFEVIPEKPVSLTVH